MKKSGLLTLIVHNEAAQHFGGNFSYIYITIKFKVDLMKFQKETTKLPQRCYFCSPSLSSLFLYITRGGCKIAFIYISLNFIGILHQRFHSSCQCK